jgi:hypothetical protein
MPRNPNRSEKIFLFIEITDHQDRQTTMASIRKYAHDISQHNPEVSIRDFPIRTDTRKFLADLYPAAEAAFNYLWDKAAQEWKG